MSIRQSKSIRPSMSIRQCTVIQRSFVAHPVLVAAMEALRIAGVDAVAGPGDDAGEAIITAPRRPWQASVRPIGLDRGVDVLVFSTDPADERSEAFLDWAEAVETALRAHRTAPRPAAA